jgi:ubiquinol-cytochrome c reductase cytochrome b subunit
LLALVAVHLAIVVRQKHTQWPGPGRTEHNVVGTRMVPNFAGRSTGFFVLVCAVIAALGGLFQINPVWIYGPYQAAVVTSASQPDWYVWFLDGGLRLFPAWEIRLFGYTVPPAFWAGVLLPGVLTVLALGYPYLEQRATGDRRTHHLLQRPRDAPTRTALGAMAVVFYIVLSLSAANDLIAYKFDISLNAMIWAGRVGLLLLPPVAYWLVYRACLALQQHDREVLVHGVETGIIRRLPDGRFVEVHQPLAEPDGRRRPELEYADWTVPKKMNRLGALVPTVKGFFVPIEEPAEEASSRPGGRAG